MKKSDIILFAPSEDDEAWHYEDPIECAQDAYEDGGEPENGHLRIYEGTVSHFEPRDFITRQGVQALVMDACDSHDQRVLTDTLDNLPPELFDSLTKAIAEAFTVWCATLPSGANPLQSGAIVDIKPHLVPLTAIDQHG
jgi:hypothetical protein